MQHVKTLAVVPSESPNGSTTSHETTSSETGFPVAWVSALFKRFQAIYGQRFTSRIDGIEQAAIREWAVGLQGLTGDQIKAGIERCVTRTLEPGEQDWPPTPAEFRMMCLPEKTPAYHRDYVALPKPLQDPDVVARSLAAMRGMLR